jgi:hypothetical protein
MDKYKIIDNFLNEDDFLNLKNTFFPKTKNSQKLPWNYQKGIVRDPESGPTGYEEHDWMYSHSFISTETNKKSEYLDLISPIFQKLNASQILDARANLLVPAETHIHHEDHVDRKTHHKVALFYVTTNNGHTVLKDIAEVKCIENRILIFDGSIYHHSVTSTDEVRCAININFIPYSRLGNINFIYK